jgi:hypothetical protein
VERLRAELDGTDSFNAGARGNAAMWEDVARELGALHLRECDAENCRTCAMVAGWNLALHPSAPTPATEAKKFPPHRPVGSPVQPPRVGKMRCCWDHENGVDASRPCGPTPPETTETREEEER